MENEYPEPNGMHDPLEGIKESWYSWPFVAVFGVLILLLVGLAIIIKGLILIGKSISKII